MNDQQQYDGHVTPGGPAQHRQLGCLTLSKLAVDEQMSNNCYLLHCRRTDEAVLIDAAADAEALRALIGDVNLTSIVTTHQHWDHHRALAEIAAEHPDAHVVVGEPDADAVQEQTGVSVTRRVGDGDRVAVGTCDLTVIRLTGHTPGSIALLFDDPEQVDHPHLFTGDSLFPGGVGNTFGDDDAFRRLLADVEEKVFDRLPDETVFYPGHGDDGVLGEQRPHLAEWRDRGW